MDQTERLSLPLLAPGQAQKELFHNEALQLLDAIVGAAVEDLPSNDPPQAPIAGTSFVIGTAPTADWSGYPAHLAAYTSAGWRFIPPVMGFRALVKTTGTLAEYGPSGWEIGTVRASELEIGGLQVVGPQAAAIADVAGGTTIDSEARLAISAILSALRQHGLISE